MGARFTICDVLCCLAESYVHQLATVIRVSFYRPLAVKNEYHARGGAFGIPATILSDYQESG